MKGKRIKVGIKDLKSVLDIVVRRETPLSGGGIVAEEKGTYFTSFEAFRKALTPKRLELLHIIKAQKPSSIHDLAQFTKRFSVAGGLVKDSVYLSIEHMLLWKPEANPTKRFNCPSCGQSLWLRLLPFVHLAAGQFRFSYSHCGTVLTYNTPSH
jgi:hypothetical protein